MQLDGYAAIQKVEIANTLESFLAKRAADHAAAVDRAARQSRAFLPLRREEPAPIDRVSLKRVTTKPRTMLSFFSKTKSVVSTEKGDGAAPTVGAACAAVTSTAPAVASLPTQAATTTVAALLGPTRVEPKRGLNEDDVDGACAAGPKRAKTSGEETSNVASHRAGPLAAFVAAKCTPWNCTACTGSFMLILHQEKWQ